MKKCRILVVDSGIDIKNQILAKNVISGYGIEKKNGKYVINSNMNDDLIGHGTAVISIINKMCNNCEIIPFRLFINDFIADEEALIKIMEFIVNEIECDIINFSLGITYVSDIKKMQELCSDIRKKGIIIIASYDNEGAVSYPACFKEVIGVDDSEQIHICNEYYYVKNSIINIIAKGGYHRVEWLNGKKIFVKGKSFATAYITSIIANIFNENNIDRFNIEQFLEKNATKIYENEEKKEKSNSRYYKPEKAVIFPFNKEIHSIAKFEKMLEFQVSGYYDIIQAGQLGKEINQIVKGSCDSNMKIKNYKYIEWETDFDTVILGHVDKISSILKQDIKKYFMNKCLDYNKNIIVFDGFSYEDDILLDQFSKKGLNAYSTIVTKEDIPKLQNGKMYSINKPILGIFGTSSKQGKFTLQLELRKKFLEEGYCVGQLGTEPQSILFGADEIYPMGYNSNIYVKDYEAIMVLNKMMHNIELKNPDIIIVGCQSNTIPYEHTNIRFLTIGQLEFIYGVMPDIIILCVNLYDDIDYIERTVRFIESSSKSKVIALVTFPVVIEFSMGGMDLINSKLNIKNKIKILEASIGIPSFRLGNKSELQSLFNICINYFEA